MNVNSRNKLHRRMQKLSVIAACMAFTTFAWGQTPPQSANCGQIDPISGEPYSCFTNKDSIANTRHNFSPTWSAQRGYMNVENAVRNDYQEVCVYCHTPHGANTTIAVPLWNRTIRATAYQTYNQLNTGSFSVAPGASMQPGAASLSCLSCHDGQTAIDSIINMPSVTRNASYSGRYLASQQTTQNLTFLNSWNNPTSGYQQCCAPDTAGHQGMNSKDGFPLLGTPNPGGYAVGANTGGSNDTALNTIGCLSCHSENGTGAGAGSTHDMRLAFIGTDLKNDHPIGVKFPTTNGAGTDWKTPTAAGSISFFESATGSTGLDKTDIRLYQTAGEARVECASCHDPHGVPSAGPGTEFIKTFLRKDNKASGVCFSCHTK